MGVQRLTKDTDRLNVALGNSTHKTKAFKRSVDLVKIPALITGLGLATQGLSSFTAGVVAASSALGPLAGQGATVGSVYAALGQGFGVVKLAATDLKEALGGNEKALARLSPVAREFVDELKGMKGRLDTLRDAAGRGLFGGASKGIRAAVGNFDRLRVVVRDTGKVIGDLVRRTGELLGSKSFGKDFATIGERNAKTISRLGRATINLVDAFRHVLVAAGPLVDWTTRGALAFSRLVKQEAEAGRESGRLAAFFGKTRQITSILTSLVGHLAKGLYEVGKAAAPLGREMLQAIDASAGRFERWTKSMSGKNQLRDYFAQARTPLFETGRLFADFTKSFLRLGNQPGFANLINSIRTQLLPVFEQVIASTTAAFGPVLIQALTSVLRLFGQLAGSSGPLTAFVESIGNIAEVFADLLASAPGLQTFVITMAGMAAVMKTMNFAAAITGLRGMTQAVKGLRTAQGTGAAVGAGSLLGPIGMAVGAGVAISASQGTWQGAVFDKLSKQIGNLRSQMNTMSTEKLRSIHGVLQGLANDPNFAKFKTQLQEMADEFSPIRGAARRVVDSFRGILDRGGPILKNIRQQVKDSTTSIESDLGTKTKKGKEAMVTNFAQASKYIGIAMDKGMISTERGLKAIHDLMSRALKSYGLKTQDLAKFFAQHDYSGGIDAGLLKGPKAPGKAGGGWIGGQGNRDTVPIMAAPGEAVVNRHQQAPIDRALRATYGYGLDGLFSRVKTPHYMAAGGIVGGGVIGRIGNRALQGVSGLLDWGVRGSAAAASLNAPGAGSTTGLVAQVRRALAFARRHGWSGGVTSGFRSREQQAILYQRYLSGTGNLAAPPGSSSHERGLAVDVSDPEGFARAMGIAPQSSRLYRRVSGEPWHFSVSGYARGGFVKMAKGGKLGIGALKNLWTSAGGSASKADTMAAIAMAESSGNPSAHNPATDDRGLWQINWPVWGATLGKYGSPYSPRANAKMAKTVLAKQGLGAWVAYKSKAYKKFLTGGGGGVGARSAGGRIVGGGSPVGRHHGSSFTGSRPSVGYAAGMPQIPGVTYGSDLVAPNIGGVVYGPQAPAADDAAARLLVAIDELKDEIKKQNAFAERTHGVIVSELNRGFVDWMTGQLGGRGAASLRTLSPGASYA